MTSHEARTNLAQANLAHQAIARRALPKLAAAAVLLSAGLACGGDPVSVNPPPPPSPPPVLPPPSVPPLIETPVTAVTNVTVIPMDQPGVLTGYTVVTDDGFITSMGPSGSVPVPSDALVIDGTGRFLIMHTHLAAGGFNFGSTNQMGPRQLVLYLANGVTTILNQGDFGIPLAEWTNGLRTGDLVGPSLYAAKFARGAQDGPPTAFQVNTSAAAAAYVQRAKAQGYHFIKAYNWTPSNVFRALVSEAERQGLSVVGHIPATVGGAGTLASGLKLVTHAGSGGFLDEVFTEPADIPLGVQRTLESRVWVTATLAVEDALARVFGGNGTGEAAVFTQPGAEYAHPVTLQNWRNKLFTQRLYNPPGSSPGELDAQATFIKGYTTDLADAGVRLLSGSDSPSVLLMPGFSMRDELLAHEAIGLSRFETLATATRNPGDFIAETVGQAERFGTVSVGNRADLLLLDANPLNDLNHLFDQRVGVMARGVWYTETELETMLEALRSN